MIKKSILFTAMFASCAINASTLPQPKITVTTNLTEFNDNTTYIKEHQTEKEVKAEINRFMLENYGQTANLENRAGSQYAQDFTKILYSDSLLDDIKFHPMLKTSRQENSVLVDKKFGSYSGQQCRRIANSFDITEKMAWFIWERPAPNEPFEYKETRLYFLDGIGKSSYVRRTSGNIKKDKGAVAHYNGYYSDRKVYIQGNQRNFYSGNRYIENYSVCEIDTNLEANTKAMEEAIIHPEINVTTIQEIDTNRVQNCTVGNPCDIVSGAKMEEAVDIVTKDFYFARYYNSYNNKNINSTGYMGWSHSYSNNIRENISSLPEEFLIHDYKHNANSYKKVSGTFYKGLYEANTSVEILAEENEVYENRAGKTFVYYLSTGTLKRIIDGTNILTFKYIGDVLTNPVESITSNSGKVLNFVYENNTYLKEVFVGNKKAEYLQENLNPERNLVGVNYIDIATGEQTSKTYHYNDTNYASLLTGITDEKGVLFASWEYDADGKAIMSTHSNGYERVDISRTEGEWNTIYEVTNSKGHKKTFDVNKRQGKGLVYGSRENQGTPEESYESFAHYGWQDTQYLKTGFYQPDSDSPSMLMPVAESTADDINMNTQITYNELNQTSEVKQTEYAWYPTTGESTQVLFENKVYEYEKAPQIAGKYRVKSITGLKNKVEYDYLDQNERATAFDNPLNIPSRDLYGNLVQTITLTDLTDNVLPYSNLNNTREIKFSYHDNMDLKAVDGARTNVQDITYFEYVKKGVLKYSMSSECVSSGTDIYAENINYNLSNPNCRYITYDNFTADYDSPQTMIDENGLITNVVYNVDNQIKETRVQTASGEVVTTYDWNEVNQLDKITLPNGSWLKYTYNDARYMTKIENSLGESIEFDVDTEGLTTERRIKSSTGSIVNQQNWVFDNANKLLKTISGNLFETSYNYVSHNNKLESITDHLGNVNKVAFNGFNEVKKEVDALDGEILRRYDPNTNTETVTDQRGNKTIYTKNGFGNVVRQESPDTGITDMWYDNADNMIKQVLADGTEINYDYDASNRLTDIRYPDSSYNVHFDYDTSVNGKGKVALITYKYGTITYDYTELGMIDTQTNVINSQTYVFDYDYTNWGALNAITYPSGRKVSYGLESLDRVTSVSVDGQVIVDNIEYLPFGSFKSFDYGNGMSFIGDFDKDYLVRNVTHTTGTTDLFNETYGYEKMYQINTITDNVNPLKNQTFVYDAKSQLTQAVGDYGQYDYTLDEVGNRLSKTFNTTEIESYNVDPLSNRLLSVDKDLLTRTLNYDANGNVIEDIGYDEVSKLLNYGDNNRLVSVDSFVYGYNPMQQRVIDNGKINNYDIMGNMVSVHDNGNIIEYIYLGNTKVAMLVDNGVDLNVYYAHNNYMGLPRLFTDENMNVVWSGDFTPFGELYNENGSVSSVIRFTGQYDNLESNYFYNYHRDYDPSLGRYLQSDPIGLNGGINTYAYVAGNPINFVDPLGLYYLGISTGTPRNSDKYWKPDQGDHVWLDIYNEEGIIMTTLGLFPNSNLTINEEYNNSYYIKGGYYSYIVDITKGQYLELLKLIIEEDHEWGYINNCANWSSKIFNKITGFNFGHKWDRATMFISTPRSISYEIQKKDYWFINQYNYKDKRYGFKK